MQATDITHATIAELGAALRRRDLSPVELTEAYLGRIERLNPTINAYTTVAFDRARADAQRATAELTAGTDRGPLHGVPVGLKDLYDTADISTAGGTKILAHRGRRRPREASGSTVRHAGATRRIVGRRRRGCRARRRRRAWIRCADVRGWRRRAG
jgi:Asp-tRNA(Asn)/Glu-tRNA(Gln) amidotransferase A subunit family amidase